MEDDDGHTLALDVPEKQVLVYMEDAAEPWQHRLLLRRLEKDKPTWIVATPDKDVETIDLSAQPVRMLGRKQKLPDELIDAGVYAFDPLTDEEMRQLKAEAVSMAEVLGSAGVDPGAVDPGSDAIWLVADPGHEKFNTEVPVAVLGASSSFLYREHVGLCKIAEEWMACEYISPSDRDEWLDLKRSGSGRDPRLSEAVRTVSSGLRTTLRDAASTYIKGNRDGWPFRGPDAVAELVHGILATGLEPAGFVAHWKQNSGVSPNSGVAIEFGVLMTVLGHMACLDQYNLYHSASAEMIARRLLMIMRAVKRNPRAPDFEGLDSFLSTATDMTGGVVTLDFDKYISELQRNDAQIMKQNRMLKEEQTAHSKKPKDPPAGGPGR